MAGNGGARVVAKTLPPGARAGEYEIQELLGEGGMGQVYAALHPVIGRRAAIKVLLPKFSSDVEAVERFVTEARAANHIGHANIVDVFAFGTLDDGRHFMVMEMLVGETLKDRIERGPLPEVEALAIADPIASGLIAAHAKGIVHRDLKPDNIFLVARDDDDRPSVKLLDFGIAKLMLGDDERLIKTQTGVMIGTPAYMAPEQARGEHVQEAVDLYSLGVVLYEALTGELPFGAGNMVETLFDHATVEPPRPSRRVPLRTDVDDLVVTLMAKSPQARPSFAAVRAIARRVRDGVPAPEVDTVAAPRRRGWGFVLAAPIIVAGGAVASYVALKHDDPPSDPAPAVEPARTAVPSPPPVHVDAAPVAVVHVDAAPVEAPSIDAAKPSDDKRGRGRPAVRPPQPRPQVAKTPPPPVVEATPPPAPTIDTPPPTIDTPPPTIDKPAPKKKDKDGLMEPTIPGAK